MTAPLTENDLLLGLPSLASQVQYAQNTLKRFNETISFGKSGMDWGRETGKYLKSHHSERTGNRFLKIPMDVRDDKQLMLHLYQRKQSAKLLSQAYGQGPTGLALWKSCGIATALSDRAMALALDDGESLRETTACDIVYWLKGRALFIDLRNIPTEECRQQNVLGALVYPLWADAPKSLALCYDIFATDEEQRFRLTSYTTLVDFSPMDNHVAACRKQMSLVDSALRKQGNEFMEMDLQRQTVPYISQLLASIVSDKLAVVRSRNEPKVHQQLATTEEAAQLEEQARAKGKGAPARQASGNANEKHAPQDAAAENNYRRRGPWTWGRRKKASAWAREPRRFGKQLEAACESLEKDNATLKSRLEELEEADRQLVSAHEKYVKTAEEKLEKCHHRIRSLEQRNETMQADGKRAGHSTALFDTLDLPTTPSDTLHLAAFVYPERIAVLPEAMQSAAELDRNAMGELWGMLRDLATKLYPLLFSASSVDVRSAFKAQSTYELLLDGATKPVTSREKRHQRGARSGKRNTGGTSSIIGYKKKGTLFLTVRFHPDRSSGKLVIECCRSGK